LPPIPEALRTKDIMQKAQIKIVDFFLGWLR